MGWHMHEMGGGAWIYLLLLIIIFAIAAVYVVRATLNPTEEDETALGILKKRYARGEISKDEFEKMKKDIGSE